MKLEDNNKQRIGNKRLFFISFWRRQDYDILRSIVSMFSCKLNHSNRGSIIYLLDRILDKDYKTSSYYIETRISEMKDQSISKALLWPWIATSVLEMLKLYTSKGPNKRIFRSRSSRESPSRQVFSLRKRSRQANVIRMFWSTTMASLQTNLVSGLSFITPKPMVSLHALMKKILRKTAKMLEKWSLLTN